MDVTKLCRGCMKDVASWEKGKFDAKAVEMFCFCTNIRITEEDRLPKQFCYDCIIKMESSYTFITEAQKVNVTLKNIVSRTNSVIVEPETVKTAQIINTDIKLTLPDYKISSVIKNYSRILTDSVQIKTIAVSDDHFHEFSNDDVKVTKSIDTREKCTEVKSANVCLLCLKNFTTKTWYDKHMQKEHSGNKYICSQCPKSFSRPSQLAYHSVTHSDERKFSCTTCGKTFKRKKQLEVHNKAHGDARPYICDKCNARFKSKSILKSHLLVHEERKLFLCYVCGVRFSQAGNLSAHVRSHSGEKPYACGRCGYRAALPAALRRHSRLHLDTGRKLCPTCGKPFADASNLTRHIRTHTGEQPYKCPLCARGFLDSWKRKTHLMHAHKMALHDIPKMRSDGRIVQ